MIEVKKAIPTGTVVEFIEFDEILYYREAESSNLEIGGHYLTSPADSIFSDIGMILVTGKSGNTVLLKESQYRVVQVVQKPIVQLLYGDPRVGIKSGYYYEAETYGSCEYIGNHCVIIEPNIINGSIENDEDCLWFQCKEILSIKGTFYV